MLSKSIYIYTYVSQLRPLTTVCTVYNSITTDAHQSTTVLATQSATTDEYLIVHTKTTATKIITEQHEKHKITL